jgi:preprotein translocase subunit YajC
MRKILFYFLSVWREKKTKNREKNGRKNLLMRGDGVIEDAGLLVLVRGHEVVLVQLQGHSRQNNFILRNLS